MTLFIGDVVEKNGKTVRENNMEISHNIPVDTLVEVKYDNWHGDGACEKVHARLWVVKHGRDCDGEPLYVLSHYKLKALKNIVHNILGIELLCPADEPSVSMREVQRKNFWSRAGFMGWTRGNFGEESLTPVEVTEELKGGEGSLNWDDDEV